MRGLNCHSRVEAGRNNGGGGGYASRLPKGLAELYSVVAARLSLSFGLLLAYVDVVCKLRDLRFSAAVGGRRYVHWYYAPAHSDCEGARGMRPADHAALLKWLRPVPLTVQRPFVLISEDAR